MRSLIPILLITSLAPAATLYEDRGVTLEGSVRLAGRAAATCRVSGDDQLHQGNDGMPLHVWRLDYGAFNASGQSLSQLTAHFQIEAEWPPCTNWTGLGQFPGPVQWAGSFETVQRPGGLQPGGQASATTYVLAIDGQQPRFARWQLDFRFGEATGAPEPAPKPITPEPPPRPGETFRDCEECPEMVVMPGGRLALGRYETTVGEYRAFASATAGGGDAWHNPDFAQTDRHPVTLLSWDDVQAYLSWLSEKTGAEYRLPTEPEWQSAADGSRRGCDHERTGNQGTCPVGSYGTNPAGLSDIVGNLWEWTQDCWKGNCSRRVIRGGSWIDDAEYLHPGARYQRPTFALIYDTVGFRVAKTLD